MSAKTPALVKAQMEAISEAAYGLGCLGNLLHCAGAYASDGGDWTGKEVSTLGCGIVWAAAEIERHYEAITAALAGIERASK